jgi:hypothetical protein
MQWFRDRYGRNWGYYRGYWFLLWNYGLYLFYGGRFFFVGRAAQPAAAPAPAPTPSMGAIVQPAPAPAQPAGPSLVGPAALPTIQPVAVVGIAEKVIQQNMPINPSEQQLYNSLMVATERDGKIPYFQEDYENNRLDDVAALGWLSTYVYIANKAGMYQRLKMIIAQESPGAEEGLRYAMGTIGAAMKGPLAFASSWLSNLFNLIQNAIKKVEYWKEIHRKVEEFNTQVMAMTGPPPAMIDNYLLQFVASLQAKAAGRSDWENVISHDSLETGFLHIAALGCLAWMRSSGINMYPPLSRQQISTINSRWTLPGYPIEFFTPGYAINGPPWMHWKGSPEIPKTGRWATRRLELTALTYHYRARPGKYDRSLIAPIKPYSKSNLARLAQLKRGLW